MGNGGNSGETGETGEIRGKPMGNSGGTHGKLGGKPRVHSGEPMGNPWETQGTLWEGVLGGAAPYRKLRSSSVLSPLVLAICPRSRGTGSVDTSVR